MNTEKKSQAEFIPEFEWSFIKPKYWGVWLGAGALIALSYIPAKVRNPVLGKLGRFVGRKVKVARRRAQINLYYCFPQWSDEKREAVIDEMFATVLQTAVLMAEQSTRRADVLMKRVRWHGYEHVEQAQQDESNVILLVPHGWGIDIPAMLIAAKGIKVAGMFHHQSNPLVDWMWNSVRRRFGGRLHAGADGIQRFISSVRHGYWGYYLPDQDHGAEHSKFVDFFATYKATLPAIGRLQKVCRARIIPLFPVYDGKEDLLHIHIHPPMEDDLYSTGDEHIARRMNEEVEKFVEPYPEQYTWVLRLLKTRKEGEIEPYSRKELFPKTPQK